MEHAVLAELAWQLSCAGHPTLRFNFARSDGDVRRPVALTLEALNADLEESTYRAALMSDAHCALDHLVATHPAAPVAAVGFGLGAWVALGLSRRPEVVRAGLIAPAATPSLFEAAPAGTDVFSLVPSRGPGPDKDALHEVLGPQVPIDMIRDADSSFVRGLSELGRRAVQRIGV